MVLEEGVLGDTARPVGTGAPTVVYVVMSHDNPRQVVRLLDRLRKDDPDGRVVVQHDAARSRLELGALERDPRVHLMPANGSRRWGRYSITRAILETLEYSVDRLEFDWLTVISGQDYPTQPLSRFKRQLATASHDAFVQADLAPGPGRLTKEPYGRYLQARYYFRWYELPEPLVNWATSAPAGWRIVRAVERRFSFVQPFVFLWTLPRGSGSMVGIRRRRVPFDSDFRCYTGSVWMTLSRHASETIIGVLRSRPELSEYYRRTVLSAESLLPTILFNSGQLRVCPENHHFCRMSGAGEAHASVLRAQDVRRLVAGGKTFARKFDDRVDPAALDALDAHLDAAANQPLLEPGVR